MNTELNPKLFNEDNSLKPEIRERLIEIANEFLRPISKNLLFKVYDIRLVGSNAGYNYTDTSDIDLHMVVNLVEICRDCPEVVQFLFNAEKSKFNLLYDIEVKGIDVEVYVEDIRAGTHSNGIYSVLDDEWIKMPEYSDIDYDLLYDETRQTAEYIKSVNLIDDVINNGTAEEIQDLLGNLYLGRKSALDSEGELGVGNILFKTLRADGYIDELRNSYYNKRSDELTLETYKFRR